MYVCVYIYTYIYIYVYVYIYIYYLVAVLAGRVGGLGGREGAPPEALLQAKAKQMDATELQNARKCFAVLWPPGASARGGSLRRRNMYVCVCVCVFVFPLGIKHYWA